MFFHIALNYLTGYLKISVEGYFIERFINICISKNILLWGIKREKSSFLYANIGKNEFKKLKQIARKTRCKIKIEEKRGMPFLLYKYKKRKIFLVFLCSIIVAIYLSSYFIWNIEIVGCSKIDKAEIVQELNENGLDTGILKNKIDTKKIINNIRLRRNDIAWMGIDISGTNAVINIVEADEKPEIIKEDEYCNIVSEKEGMITKIVPLKRHSLSKSGRCCKKRNYINWRLVRRKVYWYKVCTWKW